MSCPSVMPSDKLKTGDKAVRLVPKERCQVISEPVMVAGLPGKPKEPIAGAPISVRIQEIPPIRGVS